MAPRDTKTIDVRRFIDELISGPEQLNILLLLRRDATRFWDAARVAATLHLTVRRAADHLEALASRGLLDVRIGEDVVYRFSPADPALLPVVAHLADAYKEKRTEILALLSSRRRRSLREVGRAFRLRRRRDDG